MTSARGNDCSQGFTIPGTGPIKWTIAEAGMACAGIPRHIYHALLYSYACDYSQFYGLVDRLEAYGRLAAKHYNWPKAIFPHRVATVVLLEERTPSRFVVKEKEIDPRCTALEIMPYLWKRSGSRAYQTVHSFYRAWLDVGCAQMKGWLRA